MFDRLMFSKTNMVLLSALLKNPCSNFSEQQVHKCVYMSSHVCVFVGGEVVLSDKGTRLEPPGFIWAKQEGPRSVWAPLLSAVGPQSREQKVPPHNSHLSSSQPGTNLSLYIHTASSLSFFHCPLYPLHFSPRPWPGLLLPLPLWTLWCWLCWPFPQIMCTFGMAPLLNPQSVYEYTFHKQDM